MRWLCPLLLAALLGPVTALAEALPAPLAGADDPQFQSLIARLLTADDPAAIVALHDLAARGNTAGLVALPVAESWFPAAPSLPERIALREINGKWVEDLAASAFKPAALWQGGAISPDIADQLSRAQQLYALGYTAKADALLEAWFNHMPETAPLPDGFADLPAATWLKAMILEAHVARGDRDALPVLQSWLDQDRTEGWMVLAAISDLYSGQQVPSGLTLGPNAKTRLQDGRLARKLLWQEEPPPPLPPDTTAMLMQALMPSPQLAPVSAYCKAHCPGSTPACETAFVTLYGQPYHAVAALTPWSTLVSAADFFASPRGEQVLLGSGLTHRLGLDRKGGYRGALTGNAAWQAANTVDACLAAGALRAQVPLPASP